nr:hypothetical protein [Tanacetum cinerariifolium]
NIQFSQSLRARHYWDADQLCFSPVVDAWGELDVPGIFAAGDGAGIGGAQAAALQGELAGLGIAQRLGAIEPGQRDPRAATLRERLALNLRIRPFLDALRSTQRRAGHRRWHPRPEHGLSSGPKRRGGHGAGSGLLRSPRDDGYAVPYKTVTSFRHAAQRLGVKVLETTPAQRIEQRGSRWQVSTPTGVFSAEHLVITAGAWARELAEQVGESVPAHPEGLMLMVTHRVAPFCAPVLGATGRSLSFKQFANGTVVIGGKLIGTVDFPGRHGEVDLTRLSISARTVTDLFPHLKHLGVNRIWAGVEAFTADDLPVIGASRKASNLSYSFGFCGSGFQMGPGTGKRLAQQILGEHSDISL